MHVVARIRRAVWGIRQEAAWGWRHVRTGRRQYFVSILAYRWLALSSRHHRSYRRCRLVTDDGDVIHYRRCRGDIQGIREIYIDEIYRLPEHAAPHSLVDLGANIGLATVWFCRRYNITTFVALEPLPENFEVLGLNCAANGLNGDVRQCAVGPARTRTHFDIGLESNLGRVGSGDLEVDVIGVEELVASLGFAPSLLKMDIEGMENSLVHDVAAPWINAFELVSMEMHPQYFDIGPLIEAIVASGFTYFEPIEVTSGVTRSKRERLFVRKPSTLAR